MAISFDACSKAQGNSASTFTCSHILGSGSNRMLIVGLACRATASMYVNYVRYNGVGMNYLNYNSIQSGADTLLVQLWCMYESTLPSAGTYNITANTDITIDEGWFLFGLSYFGVMQRSPEFLDDTNNTGTALDYQWVDALQINERIVYCGATALLQTPSATGTYAQVIASGGTTCSGNQTAMGGILARDAPQSIGADDTFGFSVASSARNCVVIAEFLPQEITKPLSGRRSTSAQGTLAKSESRALTGSRSVGSAGTLSKSESRALTGSRSTGSAGTLSKEESVALTGEELPGTPGTLSAIVEKALTGEPGTIIAGTISNIIEIGATGKQFIIYPNAPLVKLRAIKLLEGLFLNYKTLTETDPIRIMLDGTVYALYINYTCPDTRAGCVRMKVTDGVNDYIVSLDLME